MKASFQIDVNKVKMIQVLDNTKTEYVNENLIIFYNSFKMGTFSVESTYQ